MRRIHTNIIGGIGSIPLLGLALVSCKFSGGGAAKEGKDSIVAAVGGISDNDINLNLAYKLLCKDSGGQTSRKPLDGQISNKTKIVFANASEVKPTDKCAFEARLSSAKTKEPPFNNYVWHAASGDKKEVGLMYASQQGQVTSDRKLTLEVFKVYDPPADPNGFQAIVKVSLPEDKDVTVANLKGCTKKDGGKLDNAGGEVSGNGGSETARSLSFNLSKDYMEGKCTSISVLDIGSKQSYSLSNVTTIVFSGVKAKDNVTFPKDGSVYKLTKDATTGGSGASDGGLDVDAKDKGECKNFDISTRQCKDGGGSPASGNVSMVAKTSFPTFVQLTATKGGKTETLYMTGKNGLSGLPADVTLAALNNGAFNTQAYSFFKPNSGDFNPKVILDKPLSAASISGSALGSKLTDLKDYKFTKINGAWSQKFISTSRPNIDKFSNPVWFASVTIAKGDAKDSLIVMKEGFTSTIKDKLIPPGKTASDSTYFNWDAVVKAGAKGYSVYQMKKCGRKISDVEKTMSGDWGAKTIEDLRNAERSLQSCKVSAGDDPIKGGWKQADVKLYQLLWISIAK